MSICNLIEYSDNHSKTSGSLLRYCSGKPAIDANGNIIEFTNANAITNSFKLKERKTDKTENDDTKDFEILVPLKYLSNFERTLEMALRYSEVNLSVCKMFYSSWYCGKTSTNICNNSYKLYALVVTLSTQDNAKLLQQLKSGFKNTIKWNKYRSKVYFLQTIQMKNYNVMTDGRNFFDQPVKSNLRAYDNIRKIVTGQGDDYTIGCLLDYPYF